MQGELRQVVGEAEVFQAVLDAADERGDVLGGGGVSLFCGKCGEVRV